MGVCRFMRADGVTKLRPWDTPEEMDEEMVKRWNAVVKPNDRVYHLGDVVINRKALHTLGRLNGRKVLIKGNHDIFKLQDYLPYFDDIRGSHKLDNFILSHIPIHAESLARWSQGNIHGHLHSNNVMLPNGLARDMRYTCVCVEQINFTPIEFSDLKNKIAAGTI